MTKYKCEQKRCAFYGCVIETVSSMPDEHMVMCPVEDNADWVRVKEVAKDQAVLFV